MKELTLAVRHDDSVAFAEFDTFGNISNWRIAIDIKHLNDTFDGDVSYTAVMVVGKEQTEDVIKCEIFDTFELSDELGKDATNIIKMPGFGYYANEVLSLYMTENEYVPENELLN